MINLLVLQSMDRSLVRVLQRGGFKDANLVLVRGGDFPRVRAAVQRRDADIVMNGARDYLHPFKGARQYHNVTSSSVGLRRERFKFFN